MPATGELGMGTTCHSSTYNGSEEGSLGWSVMGRGVAGRYAHLDSVIPGFTGGQAMVYLIHGHRH